MPSKLNLCKGSLRIKRCGNYPGTHGHLSEAKRATHDGYIWPVDRSRMADVIQIANRMAEDAGGLIRDRGADAIITVDDFLSCGWTIAQILRVGSGAIALIEVNEDDHVCAA